ncbi:WD40 repeat-like protein [Backusella circina FSU 941]|nr:WD40 repeat-like protein [Backusella circina FSU 941]
MTLTGDEINLVIYKYLQESGFRHSAFAFQYESQVDKADQLVDQRQSGLLVNIIHKGLQFMEIEAHLDLDGELKECDAPFSLLQPHHCNKTLELSPPTFKRQRTEEKKSQREKRAKREEEEEPEENVDMIDVKEEEKPSLNGSKTVANFDKEKVIVLEGHESEVFSCSWNPAEFGVLASGSGDTTARLWRLPTTSDNSSNNNDDDVQTLKNAIVLDHSSEQEESKDVTALDWNPSGTLLATGSYDGQARIWTVEGKLLFTMSRHKGPIFSLKWNKKGDLILSGSADTTTIVWDAETGEMKQQFEFHSPILDVDWVDNKTFASCSTDKTIQVCRMGSDQPIKTWVGHTDEVNAVRWDPSGKYLASCSDDMSTKIWSLSDDKPIQEIRGHSQQIYTIQWAPDKNRSILATASFDAEVRLWDALSGECLQVLKNHKEAVYSISFSPDARLLASGSFDGVLNIWNIKDGSLFKTYQATGGLFEVHFNKEGNKLAACTSNKQVIVFSMD